MRHILPYQGERVMKVRMMVLFVLVVFATTASASDHTFRFGDAKPASRSISYYGVGTPCVVTASFYGITATVREGMIVHMIIVTKQGVNDLGWDTKTGAILTGLKFVQSTCGDTLLLLPKEEQKKVKPFLLAKK